MAYTLEITGGKQMSTYPQITTVRDGDDKVLLSMNDGSGEKLLPLGAIKDYICEKEVLDIITATGADTHRNFWRGKYLGSSLTTDQLAHIKDGSFKGLYIGDYWTINGVNWRIADINYWLNCGDTNFTTPHLVIVPDTSLYSTQMNTSNVTTGAYVGSAMYKTNLAAAKTAIKNAFGSAVLTHRELLQNAVSNGKPSGGAWLDSTVELMNECMVYGHLHVSPACDGSTVPYLYTNSKTQLALFRLAPEFITNRVSYWLRDVVSSARFADVYGNGSTNSDGASNSFGVRPVFAIG